MRENTSLVEETARGEWQSDVHSSMLGWLFIGINLVGGLGLRGRGGRLADAALEGGDMSVSLLFDLASRLMFCEMMREPGRFGFSAMFLWISPFILISRKGRI